MAPLEGEGVMYEENHEGGCPDVKTEKHPVERRESTVPKAGEVLEWSGGFTDRENSSLVDWLEPKEAAGVEMWLW